MGDFMLSCDWGTSSFRLKLVDIQREAVAAELQTADGVSAVYGRWKSEGAHRSSQESFYMQHLVACIGMLSKQVAFPLSGIPVVISGMASSTIGMRQLPYAELPFSIDGSNAVVQALDTGDRIDHPVLLISGCKAAADVMRGEETQLVGLAAMDRPFNAAGEAVCIFPGTHSKHVHVVAGKMVDFATFMTGEVFHLMAHQSILKGAITIPKPDDMWSPAEEDVFRRGVAYAMSTNILSALFSVRVNELFDRYAKTENYYYLSGLLIGTELAGLLKREVDRIVLCSGSNVYLPYRLALEELDLVSRAMFVEPHRMDWAVIAGQIKISHFL
ncbi:2-dehydro-3-deoxygalactonokinase [Parapedobacter sp. DT-150]|uniref:2-dehydro-3-deoxygalactonokinase n=1 Tax=Parapedobacter sp. DT-150 TaxID=3396162 RepID=UPI003F1D189C